MWKLNIFQPWLHQLVETYGNHVAPRLPSMWKANFLENVLKCLGMSFLLLGSSIAQLLCVAGMPHLKHGWLQTVHSFVEANNQ